MFWDTFNTEHTGLAVLPSVLLHADVLSQYIQSKYQGRISDDNSGKLSLVLLKNKHIL